MGLDKQVLIGNENIRYQASKPIPVPPVNIPPVNIPPVNIPPTVKFGCAGKWDTSVKKDSSYKSNDNLHGSLKTGDVIKLDKSIVVNTGVLPTSMDIDNNVNNKTSKNNDNNNGNNKTSKNNDNNGKRISINNNVYNIEAPVYGINKTSNN